VSSPGFSKQGLSPLQSVTDENVGGLMNGLTGERATTKRKIMIKM